MCFFRVHISLPFNITFEEFIDPFPNIVFPKSAPTDIVDCLDRQVPPLTQYESPPRTDTDASHITVPIETIGAPTAPPHSAPVRTSSRIARQPSYLRDYHCHMMQHNFAPPSSVLYPLEACVSYNSLSPSYKILC